MKVYFTSGNHYVHRLSSGEFTIGISAPTISCNCLRHKTMPIYSGDFDGLKLAIDACVCMAVKSLKKDSGIKIIRVAEGEA
jgi:hypothetical protein